LYFQVNGAWMRLTLLIGMGLIRALTLALLLTLQSAHRYWRAGNQIYVEYESYAYRLGLDKIAHRWRDDIPGIEDYVVRADSSRPDTINYLARHGIPLIVGAKKEKGSVESGVEWLRSHEIIVHPRCVNFQDELKRYRYKTNKAGDVLSELEDKDNHGIDDCRYAFQPLIKSKANLFNFDTIVSTS
jgi:phage terminase large subunit